MNKKVKPLLGIRILVGRARHQASALSSALRALGAEVIEIPFIEIREPRSYTALDQALHSLESYDWLVFTSVNGVEAVWRRAEKLGLPLRHPKRLKVAAIGPATNRAILKHGFKVDLMPRQYVAEAVVTSLRGKVIGERVLLARARVARDVIPQKLRKAGALVDVVEAYETVVPKAGRSRLKKMFKNKNQHPDIITFTSSSMVKNFVALLGEGRDGDESIKADLRALDDIEFASIGPITSRTLREVGLQADIEAEEYTVPGLVAAIVSAIDHGTSY